MTRMLLGAVATAVFVVAAFQDPERRFLFFLFTFLGLLFTFRAFLLWEKKR